MQKGKRFLMRTIREGATQLWRNKFLSFTTIGLGALILFLLNFAFGIEHFAELTLRDLESRADFTFTLRDDYDSFEFQALKNELALLAVEPTLEASQEFQEFRLPTTVNIKFSQLETVQETFTLLKKPRYTEVVAEWDTEGERSFLTIIDKLLSLKNTTRSVSRALVFLFVVGGILLIINTFRIALFSRKDEVFIARLVGADTVFITAPFVFEGILLGFLSALVAIIGFVIALQQIPILPGGDIFLYLFEQIFAWEILLSGVIGGVGAWISVQRYLFKQSATI